jgi:glycosyltransferase involved in cell wall biosynthesis
MKIIVIGTRGFPNIQGGIETHCEGLYPELVKLGCEIIVIRRKPYIGKNNSDKHYKGVVFKDIWAPKLKSFEAIVHTFLGVCYAAFKRPKVLHFHGIGPSLFVPFARLLGMKVVVTSQGPDYDRQKWGSFAKFILKIGEKFGSKYSNEFIVVSDVINEITKDKYKRTDAHIIFNGVHTPKKSEETEYIESLGLIKKKYIIGVARFVEEKGFHYLIDAFVGVNDSDYKLVLVGDADHPSNYANNLKKKALANNVILTGFIKGEKLNEIFSHAKLFVLPSFHEGLSLSLLEALSYDLEVVASDIPSNLSAPLNQDSFFKVGDVEDLSLKIKTKLKLTNQTAKNELENYQWPNIAQQTLDVYKKAID